MTRTARRLALTGLTVLLLGACGEGQVRPGAAAVVGQERITSDALQQAVDRSLADPQAASQLGADRLGFQRQVLGRLISREVLSVAAGRRGVTVTDGDVDARLEQFVELSGGREALEQDAATSGIAAQDLEPVVEDVVREEALGDALTEDVEVPDAQLQQAYDQAIAKYDRVRSRHILVADEATARRTLDLVTADPSRFAALAAELSTDEGSKDSGGELGLAGRGTFLPAFEQVLFSTPPGGFGIAQTDFGWHVINVQERQTTSLAEARTDLRRTLLEQERTGRVREVLRETADELGVTVNPRFGRWDAEQGTVLPREGEAGVLSPAPVPGAGQPAPGDQPGQPAPGQPQPGQPAPGQPQPQPGEPGQPQPGSSAPAPARE